VGAPVAVITNIQTEHWYADLYGAMSMAYRLSALMKSRTAAIKMAYQIRRLDSLLDKFFHEIHVAMVKGVPKGTDTSLAAMERVAEGLRHLHEVLDRFQHACKLARLTNNSLIAVPIHNIAKHNEDVQELIDLLDLAMHPDTLNTIYARAAGEKARGEIYKLSEV
jgi:hypothetical protein